MKFHFLFLALAAGLAGIGRVAAEDEPVVPGDGYAAPRYEALWSKSPFAVASPDGVQESPDYSLVGIAQFDGVTYASLIDKKNQDRILVATGKPANGLTLVSVNRGHDANSTTAVVQKSGQTITLKLEQSAVAANGGGTPGGGTGPQGGPPAIPMLPMPGSGGENFSPGGGPPRARFRHPMIQVPQQPVQGAQASQAQPAQQANGQAAPQFQAPPPPPSQTAPTLPAGLQPPSAPPPQAPPSR